ncbi:Malignant fibrous histiocytoma-amplified sequence 1 [Pseudolycoriella hygida]|uniref:Malignant fibrous histiocytoma-amplified sequence 1 n=1 Tax=Pseudolycoriella hygida TaxID=35572 RepID=A0A9Q0N137_9DIPT|nr:Malignant fibrous histiocytoma-amplified sequence 1 [Pseudolycoriella hygida]
MNTFYHFVRDNHLLAIVETAQVKGSVCLNLSNNDLKYVPENIHTCNRLVKLFLHKNLITKLPSTLPTLINLHTLTLDYNGLNEFPKVLCELKSLTNLNISCNNIKTLPSEIGQMSLLQVRWLTLENNQLSELPNKFSSLKSLTHLNLKNNCLKQFPKQLCAIESLRYSYLCSNNISKITDEYLSGTTFMKLLDINDNPFPDDNLNYKKFHHVFYGPKRNECEYHSAELSDEDSDSYDDWENSVATSDIDTTDGSDTEYDAEVGLQGALVFESPLFGKELAKPGLDPGLGRHFGLR